MVEEARDETARKMLLELKAHCDPLLKARGWRCERLVEMCCCTRDGKNPGVAGYCQARGDKRTSLKTHPDKAGGHKALFVEVTRAYAVLSDKQLRRDYDLCCSGADAPDFQKALALIKASKRPLTLHLVRPVA